MVEQLPDRERVLGAERHLQALLPGSVLVGRTAAALHAGHRQSLDGDHLLTDLPDHLDDVLATLESITGCTTGRVQRPVVILGRLDGIMTGIRQLRRTRALETEMMAGERQEPHPAESNGWEQKSSEAVRRKLGSTGARRRSHFATRNVLRRRSG